MLEVKIKVFQKFFATKIQNPGGSSLTKVHTRDCLSLLLRVLFLIGLIAEGLTAEGLFAEALIEEV